jgi:hypothetical protein
VVVRFLVGSFIFSAFIHTLTAGEITGVIGSYFDELGKSYLGVAVEKTLVMTTPGGQTLSSDFPQLAGLDERNHRAAMQLLGRRVTITGRPMERHTVHHRTPVLWIAEKLRLAENDDSSPGRIEEVPRGSKLRAQLFDLARPEAEKTAGQPVKFEGSMKRMGDWVFFSGNVVDRDGRPIPVHGVASDTVALWRREKDRWRVLDVGAGASDAYHYYVWPEKFGAPVELLRNG